MKIRIWRPTGAHAETVELPDRQQCTELDAWGWPCLAPAHWAVAWTTNESGLPGQGTEHTAYPCYACLTGCLSHIPYEYAGAVTVCPIKEIPA